MTKILLLLNAVIVEIQSIEFLIVGIEQVGHTEKCGKEFDVQDDSLELNQC